MKTSRAGQIGRVLLLTAVAALALLVTVAPCSAQGRGTPPLPIPRVPLGLTPAGKPEDVVLSLRLLLGLGVLSLAPAILMMMTAFTRIVIVLSFLRTAIGTAQVPPNPVLAGFALFLTFFVMRPVWDDINAHAVQPYLHNQLTFMEAVQTAERPVRGFMLKQTRARDLRLFLDLARQPRPQKPDDVSLSALVPAFIISELKSAFQIGFVLYVPFLVIDLIVASALMSMGMLMLPPVTVSLPFKLLLFVMIDGWHLITRSVVLSFA